MRTGTDDRLVRRRPKSQAKNMLGPFVIPSRTEHDLSCSEIPGSTAPMITMSQPRQIVRRAGVLLALGFALAGCCGSGPSHKCNFTPPGGSKDAGMDGPELPCGTEVCELPKVCCITKVPLLARCIDASRFISERCERLDLPCTTPAQCPAGLACCVAFSPVPGVTCRPASRCPTAGGENYLACGSDNDCPNQVPGSCVEIGQSETGEILRVCGLF